jgi:Flp pilus assembly protein TadG
MKPVQATGILARARALARGCVRSDRGSVAIEFAVIVPLMMLILLGFSELYYYMRAVSLVERTAFTLANSIGQMNVIVDSQATDSSNSLGSMWSAASTLAQPLDLPTNGMVYITSVCEKTTSCTQATPGGQLAQTKGTATMLWTRGAPYSGSGMASQESKTKPLPTSWPFKVYDTAVVIEVYYKYTPFAMTQAFWADAPLEQTLYKRVYVRPRNGQALKLQAAS